MEKLRIAITGATGLIGRNLFFEIIKQNLKKLDDLEIFILGRDAQGMGLSQRMLDILDKDGREYISPDESIQEMVLKKAADFVKCIKIDLRYDGLQLSRADFKKFSENPVHFFFHLGASTDLRSSHSMEEKLTNTNINGTRRIVELVQNLRVEQFSYVGTAYACGQVSGSVLPDYIDPTNAFRNHYEKAKAEAEMFVRNSFKKQGCRLRFFRPSVTCGRLLERPFGFTNKFDVIYGWTGFFWAIQHGHIRPGKKQKENGKKECIRIAINRAAGLNIVPADYVAKMMYHICINDVDGESFHLVAEKPTPHDFYIPLLLKAADFDDYLFVPSIPNDLNRLEILYYKTAGSVFTPYITSNEIIFDTENLKSVILEAGIKCPEMDQKNITTLMSYAKEHNFGMNKS